MQNWKDLYLELSETISAKIPAIRWVDLWHNQVNFLSEEHPFPTPALFLGFRILGTTDSGTRVQQVRLQIDCFLFYETFSDTYRGSSNQESALGFLELLNDVFAVLHGSDGQNYSQMRRTGFAPVDTGGAGNLYQLSFECVLMDYAAQVQYTDGAVEGVEVINQNGPDPEEETEPFFVL